MSGKWTPGPWVWEEIDPTDPDWGACEVTSPEAEEYVCTMALGTANARLIAAAPDLYAALEAALWMIQAHEGTSDNADMIYDAARAALAKARGEAQ